MLRSAAIHSSFLYSRNNNRHLELISVINMVLSRIAARQVLARRSNLCLSASTSPWTTPSYRHNSASSSLTRPCPGCSTPLPLPASPCPKCSHLVRIPQGLSHHSMLNLSSPVQSSSSSSPSSSPSESDSKSSTETDGFVFDIPLELSKLPSHGFDLDPKDLRRRMLDRQKDLHPDKFSNQGEKMVELARELSGRVNEAYAVLGDPLKRAEYIVSAVESSAARCLVLALLEFSACLLLPLMIASLNLVMRTLFATQIGSVL